MKKKNWIFTERKGQQIINGKSHYPDSVNIMLNRKTAFDIIGLLIAFYSSDENADKQYPIYVPGALEEDKDE